MKKKNIFIIVVLTAIIFFTIGQKSNLKPITGKCDYSNGIDSGIIEKADFSYFNKAWKKLEENHVYPYLDKNGKKFEDPSGQEKVWWAIKGLANSYGDSYTDFFTPDQNKEFKEEVDSEFFGIGMRVEKIDGLLVVVSPLVDSPAMKAGIKPKDVVLEVDGKNINLLSSNDSVELIRGKKGTKVTLTIRRKGKILKIDVARDLIKIPTVETKIVNDVTIISVYSFGPETVNEFYKELVKFSEKKDDKLVIDLRMNPGGYMRAPLKMSSFFIKGGNLIMEEKGKSSEYNEKYYSDPDLYVFNEKTKIAVLIDEGSASASEIFAGILSDYDRALIVGKRSFGKGSVQELVDFTKDTSLKITVAKWYLPSDISVSKIGIIPDFEVDLGEMEGKYKFEKDLQVLKAVETVKKKDFFDILKNKKSQKDKQAEYREKEKESLLDKEIKRNKNNTDTNDKIDDSLDEKEKRCGWFFNPSPANFSLIDSENEWEISRQGDSWLKEESLDKIQLDFNEEEFVKTNINYGYGCVCLEVLTDKEENKIIEVFSSEILDISKCHNDKKIRGWEEFLLQGLAVDEQIKEKSE